MGGVAPLLRKLGQFPRTGNPLIFSLYLKVSSMMARLNWSRFRQGAVAACAMILLSAFSQMASAGFLTLSNPFPTAGGWNSPAAALPYTFANGAKVVRWGTSNNNPTEADLAAAGIISNNVYTTTQVYKAERTGANGATLTGSAASGYSTDYLSTVGLGATVQRNLSNTSYQLFTHALIKDGNSDPNWFIFDLTGVTWTAGNWDGIKFASTPDNWFNKAGNINERTGIQGPDIAQQFSHLELYSSGTRPINPVGAPDPVPEPLTAGLMLSGMACAGFAFRKRRSA
jgi:hypothetical protein